MKIYVNVTAEDGELLGRFEVEREDLLRAGSLAVQQGIGREVIEQLPMSYFDPEQNLP